MPFLELNGIAIPVADGSARQARVRVGSEWTTFSGKRRRGTKAIKREWTYSTTPLPHAEALAMAALIDGEGECWAFDEHFYSGSGLPPASTSGAAIVAGGRFVGALELQVGGEVEFEGVLPNDQWTVMAYWLEDGGNWVHALVRDDEARWADGTREDGLDTTWLKAEPGRITITAETQPGPMRVDDLVALPYRVPDDWPRVFFDRGAPFSPLPRLLATGDFDADGASGITVECEVVGVDIQRLASGVHQIITFTMREV